MIHQFSITKIISACCVIYAALVLIIVGFSNSNTSIGTQFIAATSYAFVFELALIVFIVAGWRPVWRAVPILNHWVFPDLNGDWDVEIFWQWEGSTGNKIGKAHVKQTFVKMSIELETDESESETLVVEPKRDPESGRFVLYYMYRNLPKNHLKAVDPHDGAAILKIDRLDLRRLEGNYFTNRSTFGRFVLQWRSA